MTADAQRFLDTFRPAQHAHGIYRVSGIDPVKKKRKGEAETVSHAPDAALVERHLGGEQRIGFVPIHHDGRCSFGAIDIDVYPLDHAKLAAKVARMGLPLIVCMTKSGGAHLYWFLPQPRSAAEVRAQLADWAAALGHTGVEIFPKQDSVSAADFGSWINMPYCGKECWAVDADGCALTLHEFFDAAARARVSKAPADVPPVAGDLRGAAELLGTHWTSNRDLLATAVIGSLLRKGVPDDQVTELIDAVCDIAADEEAPQRLALVLKARKAIDLDKPWAGLPKLIERIGQPAVNALLTAMGVAPIAEPKRAAPFSPELVINAEIFAVLDLPVRAPIVEGLMLERSLFEIWGWRGVGKTWVVFALALAIARGERFLNWRVPVARRVLLVDGEMTARELQDRLRSMAGAQMPCLLDLMPSEMFVATEGRGLLLNDAADQARFVGLLGALAAEGRRPDVIIYDNLSSLTAGTDENSNSEQDQLLSFFRGLRHAGYAAGFVHHAGKNGEQRGASRREDFLDLVVKLSAAEGGGSNARFKLEFTKTRGRRPDPSELELALVTDPAGTLALASGSTAQIAKPEPTRQDQILRFVAQQSDGVTRAAVEARFDIGKSGARDALAALVRKGFLHSDAPPYRATDRGRLQALKMFPEDGDLM